jgi:hypothetical protein
MLCFKCGEKISDDSNFCSSCGSRIEKQNSIKDTISNDVGKSQDTKESKQSGISNKESGELHISDSIPSPHPYDFKQRRKWGWGWIVVLISYTSYSSRNPVKIDNYGIKTSIELGGFVLLVPCYFWIRNYIGRYTDDLYKPSIISGIVCLMLVGFLHGLAEAFFRG